MKVRKGLVLVTALFLFGMPAIAADDLQGYEMNSDGELAQALAILDTMISEGQGDAVAHELRGDVYAMRGMERQAQTEYALAADIKQSQEPSLISHK